MVSLTPAQFCHAAEHHQRGRRVGEPLIALKLAKPARYEADEEYPLAHSFSSSNAGPPGQFVPPLKRLGWGTLPHDPEHLCDRVADALEQMDATYDRIRRGDCDGEWFVMNAQVDGVALRVIVSDDVNDFYRVACSRMSGDTFAYHQVFRRLRDFLGEVVADNAASRQAIGPRVRVPVSSGPRLMLAPIRPSPASSDASSDATSTVSALDDAPPASALGDAGTRPA